MANTAKAFNLDGWVNILTSLGLRGRDKRLSSSFESEVLDEDHCMQLWRGDDMAARASEKVPQLMLREGFGLAIETDRRAIESEDPDAEAIVDDPERSGRSDRRRRRDKASDVFPDEMVEQVQNDGQMMAKETLAYCEEIDAVGRFTE